MKAIEVLFTPAEFATLAGRDLRQTVCVVFDILRATSTMVTALANGAAAIVPVLEIPEALACRQRQPGVLLAGERNGVRIRGDQPGADFDLGNSPHEFVRAIVAGKTIVTTTTNGTRALRACAGARRVLVGSFLNLRATAQAVTRLAPEQLLLVCSGTQEREAFEDNLAAGALCDLIWQDGDGTRLSDSAARVRELYRQHRQDLLAAMTLSSNGMRLLAMPELSADVAYCLKCDTYDFAAELNGHGQVVRMN